MSLLTMAAGLALPAQIASTQVATSPATQHYKITNLTSNLAGQ